MLPCMKGEVDTWRRAREAGTAEPLSWAVRMASCSWASSRLSLCSPAMADTDTKGATQLMTALNYLYSCAADLQPKLTNTQSMYSSTGNTAREPCRVLSAAYA